MTAKESKAVAFIEQNRCDCHPETCCCSDYIMKVGDMGMASGSYGHMTALADLINGKQSALHAAEAELGELRRRVEAWRDFARHQEWCADCAESVANCADGKELKEAALASDGGADGDNEGEGK